MTHRSQRGVLSRRTFIGAATVAGVQLAVFGLAGCASTEDETAPSTQANSFKPGAYTGEGEGKFDIITVETTVSEQRIESIEITSSNDTARIEQPALEKIPERIIAAQGLGVDTVTGATLTSMGILSAVSSCIEQADGDVSALRKIGITEPSTETIELETDLVVVGAGAAGMGGAIAAAQGGKRVIIVEKNSNIGGNCLVSGGYLEYLKAPEDARPEMSEEFHRYVEDVLNSEIAAQSDPAVVNTVREEYEAYKASGSTKLFDSPTFYALDFAVTTGEGLPVEAYLPVGHNISALNDWMTENNFDWVVPTHAITGYQYPRWSGPVEGFGGEGYFDFYDEILDQGTMDIEIYLATAAEELITENGIVTGIKAVAEDGTTYLIGSSNVLLASGGFSGNSDMIKEYNTEWDYPDTHIPTTNVNGHTGDGITMATKVGAGVSDMGNQMLFPFNDPVNFSFEDIMGAFGDSPVVNKEGKRFVDETTDRFTITAEMMLQTDNLGFFVCDKKCSDYPSEERQETLLRRELLFKADTLEDLAEQIGCDKDTFVETIEDFNVAVAAGEDEEFGRYLFTELSSVDTPPFFASPVTWAAHITIGGLTTNEDTHEVLDESGTPIPGLYAAGETRQDICGVGSMADGFAAGTTIASA